MLMMELDAKGDPNMPKNLRAVGAGDDLPIDKRVHTLQQKVAELLSALQKAGIKTEL